MIFVFLISQALGFPQVPLPNSLTWQAGNFTALFAPCSHHNRTVKIDVDPLKNVTVVSDEDEWLVTTYNSAIFTDLKYGLRPSTFLIRGIDYQQVHFTVDGGILISACGVAKIGY